MHQSLLLHASTRNVNNDDDAPVGGRKVLNLLMRKHREVGPTVAKRVFWHAYTYATTQA
jgi:hypothetical protein